MHPVQIVRRVQTVEGHWFKIVTVAEPPLFQIPGGKYVEHMITHLLLEQAVVGQCLLHWCVVGLESLGVGGEGLVPLAMCTT